MAEKPQAQRNELGHLFVDLGISGVGKTLKSLNSVAASFLLGKNAAVQFAQTISKPFKEAGKGAIEISQLANALSATREETQKLQMYFKNFGVEDLLGDIESVLKVLQEFPITGVVPKEWLILQGLFDNGKPLFEDLSPNLEGVLKFFDRVQEGLSGMSEEARLAALQQGGLRKNWNYLWAQGGNPKDYYTMDTSNIEKNEKLAQSLNESTLTLNNFKDNVLAELAPTLTQFINSMTEWIKSLHPEKVADKIDNTFVHDKKQADIGALLGPAGVYADNLRRKQNAKKSELSKPPKEFPTGMASNIGYMGELPDILNEGAGTPPNLSGMVQNITNNISHDITITGNNAQEIADRIAGISEQDIQYSQYQAANLAGL